MGMSSKKFRRFSVGADVAKWSNALASGASPSGSWVRSPPSAVSRFFLFFSIFFWRAALELDRAGLGGTSPILVNTVNTGI